MMDAAVRARKARSLEVARYWLARAEGGMVRYWGAVATRLEGELA
jgi:hypothetical protein